MLPRSVAIGWGSAHRGSNPDDAITKAAAADERPHGRGAVEGGAGRGADAVGRGRGAVAEERRSVAEQWWRGAVPKLRRPTSGRTAEERSRAAQGEERMQSAAAEERWTRNGSIGAPSSGGAAFQRRAEAGAPRASWHRPSSSASASVCDPSTWTARRYEGEGEGRVVTTLGDDLLAGPGAGVSGNSGFRKLGKTRVVFYGSVAIPLPPHCRRPEDGGYRFSTCTSKRSTALELYRYSRRKPPLLP